MPDITNNRQGLTMKNNKVSVDNTDIDNLVCEKVFSLRKRKCGNINPLVPRFVESDCYKIGNSVYKRLRIILCSNGCSIPTCVMCPFPNEAVDPSYIKINTEHYLEQIKTALVKHQNHEVLSIYNDGSFFSESELPEQARQAIYSTVKKYGCKYLMVESLPLFITRNKLKEAAELLGQEVKLIVGIGLQSFSDEIRNSCIRTVVSKDDFLQAHELLQEFDYAAKSYLMIKPPFVLEEEAIIDAVEGTRWLYNNGVEDITLCPMRIAKNTILYELYLLKLYSAPKLTTVAECLRQLKTLKIYARVSVINVGNSDLEALTASGCSLCQDKILSGLDQHNNMLDIDFDNLVCEHCCMEGRNNDPEAFRGLSYSDRVKIWLASSNNNH